MWRRTVFACRTLRKSAIPSPELHLRRWLLRDALKLRGCAATCLQSPRFLGSATSDQGDANKRANASTTGAHDQGAAGAAGAEAKAGDAGDKAIGFDSVLSRAASTAGDGLEGGTEGKDEAAGEAEVKADVEAEVEREAEEGIGFDSVAHNDEASTAGDASEVQAVLQAEAEPGDGAAGDAGVDATKAATAAVEGHAEEEASADDRGSESMAAEETAAPAPAKKPFSMSTAKLAKRVFLRNLPWKITEEELKEHMAQAGKVVSSTLLYEPDGLQRPSGCAVVEYATAAEAGQATAQLHDTMCGGRRIIVQPDRGKGVGGRTRPEEQPSSSIFVYNLAQDVTSKDLAELMSSVGEVKYAHIFTKAGQSKGCATITFASVDDARQALRSMNPFFLKGKASRLRWSREGKHRSRAEGREVVVSNLNQYTRWIDMKYHFSAAGDVNWVDMGNGTGLVRFETREAADKAIQQLNGTELLGSRISVSREAD